MNDAERMAFEAFLAEGREDAEEGCAAFAGELDRHLEILQQDQGLRSLPGDVEADLYRQSVAIRERLRDRLIRRVPAAKGADRPTLEDLADWSPIGPIHLQVFTTSLRTVRLIVLAMAGVMLGAAAAGVLLGLPTDEQEGVTALGLVLAGTAIALAVGAAPISRGMRYLLIAGGVLSTAGIGVWLVTQGQDSVWSEDQGVRLRSLAALLVIVVMVGVAILRLWARRPRTDLVSVEASRDCCREDFRAAVESDVRLLAHLAVIAGSEVERVPEERELREKLAEAREEIASALRQGCTGEEARQSLERGAQVLGLVIEPEDVTTRFRWSGSPEELATWAVVGIVRVGDWVRATRRPVLVQGEDGASREVSEKGEVIPEER